MYRTFADQLMLGVPPSTPPPSAPPPSPPPSPSSPPFPEYVAPRRRLKCSGGVDKLEPDRAEQMLSQLRKWCYYFNRTDVGDGAADVAAVSPRSSLRLIPGNATEDWSLSPPLQQFCDQNGAMPDAMNRGDDWAAEEECAGVLKVLGLRFGADVCIGACAPWSQPCPESVSPPPPPPLVLPWGPARAMTGGARGPEGPAACNSSLMREAPPQKDSLSPPPPPPPSPPYSVSDPNRQHAIEQQSERWQQAAEPTGLAGANKPSARSTIEHGSHATGSDPMVNRG